MRFSVLEMGELKDKPDLLAAVMFSMMIYVEQRMYLSDRQQPKVCLIDEARKLLSKDNKRSEDFIENGYRTARKYNGAYITITQGIEDFDGQKASGAAKAARANSSFKIILRQNRDAFRKYCWITRRPLTALSGRLSRAFRRHVRRISVPLCCVTGADIIPPSAARPYQSRHVLIRR